MSAAARRIAVLGGTFDPVHNAHLAIITAARDALDAVEGWLVPALRPNLRGDAIASANDRRDMLAAAIAGQPGLRVVDIELHRHGYSYTIDTLDELHRRFGDVEFWWVLGADAVRRIREWHRSAELLDRARLLVVQRQGTPPIDNAELTALGLDPERTQVLNLVPPPIGATQIRNRIGEDRPIADLVPRAVAALIHDRGLYRAPAAMHNAAG